MKRRTFLTLAAAALLHRPIFTMAALARAKEAPATLLSVPLALQGAWQWPQPAAKVLEHARAACLTGVRLLSDRQPDRILVDDHSAGGPAVWLHNDGTKTAWIIVNIGGSDWCNMCYQFGHELGHVLCNSWGWQDRPRNPCQWMEEALVESFSIRGLGLLATSWEKNPPFQGDNAYGAAVRRYRQDVVAKYTKVAVEQGAAASLATWFQTHRSSLEKDGGLLGAAQGAITTFLPELEADNADVEALGAMNRWPARTGVPIQDYLQRWEKSCAEIGASSRLPLRVRSLLFGS